MMTKRSQCDRQFLIRNLIITKWFFFIVIKFDEGLDRWITDRLLSITSAQRARFIAPS